MDEYPIIIVGPGGEMYATIPINVFRVDDMVSPTEWSYSAILMAPLELAHQARSRLEHIQTSIDDIDDDVLEAINGGL